MTRDFARSPVGRLFVDVRIGPPADTFGGAGGESKARLFEVFGYAFLARKPKIEPVGRGLFFRVSSVLDRHPGQVLLGEDVDLHVSGFRDEIGNLLLGILGVGH
jgi:hypothetical protein